MVAEEEEGVDETFGEDVSEDPEEGVGEDASANTEANDPGVCTVVVGGDRPDPIPIARGSEGGSVCRRLP